MVQGYVSMVLHAHLPYVRHPEYSDCIEERWLFEAITESYIPLIDILDGLIADKVDFRLTMSITPTLLSMLDDDFLKKRYIEYLHKSIELSEKEVIRTKNIYQISEVAKMYNNRLNLIMDVYDKRYSRDLISAFRKFQSMGKLEVLACAATHAYLPLMDMYPEAMEAQIKVGIDTYKRYLGCQPHGIWLPECAYTPAVDRILRKYGIYYFIAESHGVLFAQPRPIYGTYAPIITPQGIAVFGRDTESSKQVWSADDGYPGDYDYREFYRDIGHELDYDYIKPYIMSDGQRVQTGLKYYRITGKTDDKMPYIPERAAEKAAIHAGNFIFNRQQQISYYSGSMDKPPIVVCPYDAELFGHWWYEGPKWLDHLMRQVYTSQINFKMITPWEYLNMYPSIQVAQPCSSSWGYKGYNEVWLNDSNDWIYRHLHKAVERMTEMANRYASPTNLERRALNQAVRELLLAQSSDWAFIMKTGTMTDYAANRTRAHVQRFNKLYEDITGCKIDQQWLSEIEYLDNIFPDIDYRIYSSQKGGAYSN
ncbi:MAG: 1,4-alpha-glucan branching enzyme [Clostridiales bacterium]|nr:1,4-alpha-glucan branching enzyme [Clostridiales bacterium]